MRALLLLFLLCLPLLLLQPLLLLLVLALSVGMHLLLSLWGILRLGRLPQPRLSLPPTPPSLRRHR
jgi:hypothetical protein